MEISRRLLIGCLGALTPIITNLLVVDLNTTLINLSVVEGFTYGIRLFALCAAACVVVYLNSDEERPVKLFQLGIMAPALLTSLINGAAISIKTVGQAPQGQAGAALPQRTQIPSLIGRAYADPAPAPSSEVTTAKDCLLPAELSTTQQIFKGLIGLVPDNKWYVVVGSYGALASANADASEIRTRFGGKYSVAVCKPLGGPDLQFRVVIGENLTYTDGTRLKLDAIGAGLPNSTWLWNPVDMIKAIQR